MNTTVQSLLDLYVKNGGSLTDTYADIDNGGKVGNYTRIPDCVAACAKLTLGGGLPADFPAEGAANKNKFLGFDNSGDYAALDAPEGLPDDFPAEDASNANKLIGFDNSGDYAALDAPSGLPAYTSSNNGQVLGVDDGAAAWVDPQNGNAFFDYTVTIGAQNTITAGQDVTFSAIGSAISAGKYAYARLDAGSDIVLTVPFVSSGAGVVWSAQGIIDLGSGAPALIVVNHQSNDTPSIEITPLAVQS